MAPKKGVATDKVATENTAPLKLSRKELLQLKEKKENEERLSLFGKYTGALPDQLLTEQCLARLWNRPDVSAKSTDRGFVGVVVLSKEDVKLNVTRRLTLSDPSKSASTELEAKQWGSTFALHRIASHLNLRVSLPASHQEYWLALEKARKTSPPDVQKYDYTDDPFSAKERRGRDEQEQARLEKEERERRARENDKSLRPWEAFQQVPLTAEQRRVVEDLIRDDAASGADGELQKVEMDELEREHLVNKLIQKGFLPLHAQEATLYNYDFETAVEWLCIYVPEDDLPFAFHSKIKTEITTGQSNQASLTRDWSIQHMVTAGFSTQVCQQAYDTCGSNELDALAHLLKKMSMGLEDTPALDPSAIDREELTLSRAEELEALESIYGTEAMSKDEQHHMIQVKVECVGTNVLLCVGFSENSLYPHELPAIMIVCAEIPAYIRLSMLRALATEAKNWLGMPMVFEIVNWVETNVSDFMANPQVTLVDLKRALSAGKESETLSQDNPKPVIKTKPASKRNYKPRKPSPKEIESLGAELRVKYKSQTSSNEYRKMLAIRERLPSYKFRNEIINSCDTSQVVIICGETGCGKSTQTGQFILEHCLESGRGGATNIMCTQPRRISAISLAERVAAERAESVGKLIGYSIRGELVRSSETKLTFCTTGILLRMLQGDPSLDHVSHIIVDEVHERSVDSDFLLVILRDLIKKRKDICVILMSATINSDLFSGYFGGAPVLNIPGFTHPVQDIYLNEALRLIKYIPDAYRNRPAQDAVTESTEPGNIATKAANWILRKESASNPVDYSLISAIISYICETADNDGSVLVFLQGAAEIKRCIDTIQAEIGATFKLDLIPLHSQLSPRDQSKVFRRPAKGVRKVVVSTNVAETSITIDDCVYVIDAGRVKEMRFENSTLCLLETLASKASCKQRRGRAGRVRSGLCFKLFSKRFENSEMAAHTVPEILRVPLEQLCLTLKAMGITNVQNFLGNAIDPPEATNIANAVTLLQDLNAVNRESGELTSLGRHVASLPADLRIAKMMIFGSIFRCIGPVLTIAAILSSKSPFVIPFDKREEGKAARNSFMWEKSDLLTDCRAYDAWTEACKKGKRYEMMFCEENFMSSTALVSISDLRRQYLDTLCDIGFTKRSEVNLALSGEGVCNKFSNNGRIVKAAIAAGLYPNLATVQHPEVLYMETAHGTMAKDHDSKLIKFVTNGNEEVFLHPSSCMSSVSLFEDLVIMYNQKVLTSKVYLRDATMVSPWCVLMFGGDLAVDIEGRTIAVNEFVKFQAFPRIAVLVNGLRKQLDKALAEKIEQPDFDVLDGKLGSTLIELLSQ
ncbi:P-loop containing nucleoside triphosphate hydrolase protein [Chytriomyces sp. MP71]|nr:P-loop containing nucleoside triphosphate hydrolase protein [Chytriomyces sp. MP71]